MSSLAFYAAPIENNETTTGSTQIEKKKISRNKTLKKKNSNETGSEHVKAMIDTIHKNPENNNDDSNYMGNFTPPPPPNSVGGEKIDNRQSQVQPYLSEDIPVSLEAFNTLESSQTDDYYKKIVPYYSGMSNPSQSQNEDLSAKLDQIMHLLEEQNNERTGHVTEELILYSFLGIFIIFIVDSFARVGKYVR
jgi:hypothetical protein